MFAQRWTASGAGGGDGGCDELIGPGGGTPVSIEMDVSRCESRIFIMRRPATESVAKRRMFCERILYRAASEAHGGSS